MMSKERRIPALYTGQAKYVESRLCSVKVGPQGSWMRPCEAVKVYAPRTIAGENAGHVCPPLPVPPQATQHRLYWAHHPPHGRTSTNNGDSVAIRLITPLNIHIHIHIHKGLLEESLMLGDPHITPGLTFFIAAASNVLQVDRLPYDYIYCVANTWQHAPVGHDMCHTTVEERKDDWVPAARRAPGQCPRNMCNIR
jgi:hypothetical protein